MRIVTSRIALVTRYVLYHFLVLPLLPIVLLFYFSLFSNRFVSISNKPLLTEFHRCVRTYAWIRRFLSNAKRPVSDRELSETLLSLEIDQTFSLFITFAQKESFSETFSQLNNCT